MIALENSKFRGLLIHYEGLPASVPVIILRLFGVKANDFWLKRMQEVSNFYSKVFLIFHFFIYIEILYLLLMVCMFAFHNHRQGSMRRCLPAIQRTKTNVPLMN